VGHPSISTNELALYFSSNIPGGEGGKDIWVATRPSKDQPFGKPQNLGKTINTGGDEMFPFILCDTVLYFASNGYAGMGGLDIFRSVKRNGTWSEPENLKSPVNSNGDDFGIILFPGEAKGYFSSNRTNGTGGDDIYYFYKQVSIITLSGTVKDEATQHPLPDVGLTLKSGNHVMAEKTTGLEGSYRFTGEEINPGQNYTLLSNLTGYLNDESEISTLGIRESKDILHDIILRRIPEKPIVLPEILYPSGQWELQPPYQDSLTELIRMLKANPSLRIVLSSHTDTRPIAISNDSLSQRRAQAVVDYLIARGIKPEQLIPRGYGDKFPRKLTQDMTRDGYVFKTGTLLDDAYINSLSDPLQKEAAYQLNRRTEFSIATERDTQVAVAKIPEKKVTPVSVSESSEKPVKQVINPDTLDLYTVQLAAGHSIRSDYFQNLSGNELIRCDCKDGMTRYFSGTFPTREKATNYKNRMKTLGYEDAFIVKINDNNNHCFKR
jgi:peptidoglycan-associated lipoprotein